MCGWNEAEKQQVQHIHLQVDIRAHRAAADPLVRRLARLTDSKLLRC
jgi:hypothetical protein